MSRFRRRRRGAAAVEFALVSPLLFTVAFGIIEFGRAFMVAETLNTAARNGCRTAVLTGMTNLNVTSAVNQNLTGISGTTTTILVNGYSSDVSSAVTGDSITVQISVPYTQVSMFASPTYLSATTLKANAVMRKE